ncbi:2-phosphosulfolactate phosphatase [Microbacterium sp.]|uniref:2-phosphosulfolactate phosphatase n=1 Tax=Microbacterium sp. TaxID=51671 RepID=UPI003A956DC2
MSQPFSQPSYQVRFEWGVAGLARLAPADIVVVVDVLRFSSTVTDAVASGSIVSLPDAASWSRNGAAVAAAAAENATVLVGSLRNASAVARTVLEVQNRRQARTSVNVIAAGELTDAGDLRFAVEDLLGAGTIIAALSDLGADHTSPEAAAACESARGLRRAMRHLLTASGSAKEIAEGGGSTEKMRASGVVPTEAGAASEVDATGVVPVLDGETFVAFE